MSTSTLREAATRMLALASIGAGAIHLWHGPAHLSEWRPLGMGFLAAGVLQMLWGARLMRGGGRRWLQAGLLGSLLFIGVWAITRTTGLPVGPGQVEPVGRADLLCVLLEAGVALGALTLLLRPRLGTTPRAHLGLAVSAAALGVLVMSGVAIAAPAHGHVDPPCPAASLLHDHHAVTAPAGHGCASHH